MDITITIRVTTRSSRRELIKQPDGSYKARITSIPTDGKANDELIRLLASHFNVAKSQVVIKLGRTSRKKVVIVTGVTATREARST